MQSKAHNKEEKHCWPTLFQEKKEERMDMIIGPNLITFQTPGCVVIKIVRAKRESTVRSAMFIYVLLKTIFVALKLSQKRISKII